MFNIIFSDSLPSSHTRWPYIEESLCPIPPATASQYEERSLTVRADYSIAMDSTTFPSARSWRVLRCPSVGFFVVFSATMIAYYVFWGTFYPAPHVIDFGGVQIRILHL